MDTVARRARGRRHLGEAAWALLLIGSGLLGCHRDSGTSASNAGQPASATMSSGQPATAEKRSAQVLASWALPAGRADVPQLVRAMARCRDEFYFVDRTLALVYQTRLDGTARRIGEAGKREGQFLEPTGIGVDCEGSKLYVVDVTGISLFETDTGRFVRRFPRPPGFSNRGETVIVDREGLALQTSGVWPRDMAGNWLARGTERVHDGSHFGLELDLLRGVAKPMFNPVAQGCGSPSATCWESAFDRIGGAEGGWVFAQRQSPVVAVVSSHGAVVRRIRVESVHFRRDGRTVDAFAPLEDQLAWNETNSEIARVFVVGDRLAVVHVISTTRGWRPGTWIQWAAYLNVYTLDGTILETDLPLPGLPVGRDDEALFVVDYGSQERRAGVPARVVAIGVGR